MLPLRIKDPGLSELDRKIEQKLSEYRLFRLKAEGDPCYLKDAESSYADMNSLLELRFRHDKTPAPKKMA